MMTKEAQRAELHKTIWRITNDLRGSVDGWDFKSYVLGILFYRFISENLTAYLNQQERQAGMPTSTSRADRRRRRVRPRNHRRGKGLLHPPQRTLRQRPRPRQHRPRLSGEPERASGAIFRDIEGSAVGADSEDDLKGLFDDLDVNSQKLGPTVAKRNERAGEAPQRHR